MVFRPHPQVIQRFFNINWFGPPPRVTGGSACSRIDHPASGLPRATRRALRTRFRFGSAIGLTSRHGATRRLIMQKACGHPKGAPTVRGRMISGSFHSLRKGSFHLSLTVLVRYRSADSIQPCGMGSTDSDGVSRVPPYLGCGRKTRNFAHGALTLCGRPFQAVALESNPASAVPQPRRASPAVWAPPRSLATTCGISVDFFSSGY